MNVKRVISSHDAAQTLTSSNALASPILLLFNIPIYVMHAMLKHRADGPHASQTRRVHLYRLYIYDISHA